MDAMLALAVFAGLFAFAAFSIQSSEEEPEYLVVRVPVEKRVQHNSFLPTLLMAVAGILIFLWMLQ
jgi:hypothetical protein